MILGVVGVILMIIALTVRIVKNAEPTFFKGMMVALLLTATMILSIAVLCYII